MSKNSIEIDGLKIISNKIIPFGKYVAITFFGRVYTKKSKDNLKTYLNSIAGIRMIKHESIHLMQAKQCKTWLWFYILYLWYFIKLYFCTLKWNVSYRTIPFEIEAYRFQDKPDYNETNWKKYIMTNKERKQYFIDKYIKHITI